MQKTIAFGIAALLLAVFVPSTEARTESHSYIPGPMVTVIWCSADEHALVPIGSPDDYGSISGWAFSGEPECAPQDGMNAANELQGNGRTSGGIGGAAFFVQESEKGSLLTTHTKDDLFGQDNSYQYLVAYCKDNSQGDADCGLGEEPQGRIVSAGCGAQTIQIPEQIENHWQSSESDPRFIAWDWVDSVGITDDLDICFASAGVVSGTFS